MPSNRLYFFDTTGVEFEIPAEIPKNKAEIEKAFKAKFPKLLKASH